MLILDLIYSRQKLEDLFMEDEKPFDFCRLWMSGLIEFTYDKLGVDLNHLNPLDRSLVLKEHLRCQ